MFLSLNYVVEWFVKGCSTKHGCVEHNIVSCFFFLIKAKITKALDQPSPVCPLERLVLVRSVKHITKIKVRTYQQIFLADIPVYFLPVDVLITKNEHMTCSHMGLVPPPR